MVLSKVKYSEIHCVYYVDNGQLSIMSANVIEFVYDLDLNFSRSNVNDWSVFSE